MFTSQINLSDNQLCGLNWKGEGTYTVEGIAAIADALKVTASLTSLDLGGNALCGIGESGRGRGTYSSEGIKAIADALRVCASVTTCSFLLSTCHHHRQACNLETGCCMLGRGNDGGSTTWGPAT